MAGSIWDWSLTASDNDAADADIDWREGMFPDVVNDSARMMMQRVAALLKDVSGSLVSAGTPNALTLTANSQFTALKTGMRVSFTANASNTGAATININGTGAKAIRKVGVATDVAIAAGDVIAGQIYHLVYSTGANSNAGGWILQNPTGGSDFVAGTRLAFQQAAAPIGWTKVTVPDCDNAALRVVTGSGGNTGGTVAFTTAFQSQTPSGSISSTAVTVNVAGTALTTAQLPNATLSVSGTAASAGAHTHSVNGSTNSAGSHTHSAIVRLDGSPGGNGTPLSADGPTNFTASTIIQPSGAHAHTVSGMAESAGAHTHTVGGTTSAMGSGQSHTHAATSPAHNHTFAGNAINLAVKYVDVIVCEKA